MLLTVVILAVVLPFAAKALVRVAVLYATMTAVHKLLRTVPQGAGYEMTVSVADITVQQRAEPSSLQVETTDPDRE